MKKIRTNRTLGIVAATVAMLSAILGLSTVAMTATNTGPAKTPTGWVYPTGTALTDDGNWGACGKAYFSGKRHIGTDIPAAVGSKVYAIDRGIVVSRSLNGWGDGNIALLVRHLGTRGEFIAVYGHLKSASTNLKAGDSVNSGSVIGTVGAAENAKALLDVAELEAQAVAVKGP